MNSNNLMPHGRRARLGVMAMLATLLGVLATTGQVAAEPASAVAAAEQTAGQIVNICASDSLGGTELARFIRENVVTTVLTIAVGAGVLGIIMMFYSKSAGQFESAPASSSSSNYKQAALWGFGAPFAVYIIAAFAQLVGVGDVSCLLPGL